ncbi:MAG: DinB family protein [Candidatus Acidiferrum sp.]
MSPSEISLLYDYNAWANGRVLDAVSLLKQEQFTQPLGSSFASVHDTLVHILGAERIWLDRFQRRAPSTALQPAQITDCETLRKLLNESSQDLLDHVHGLTQADLEGVIKYETISFGPRQNPLWQSLQHLVNHGTYHRGQVTTMLRQLGVTPVSTDLMRFYWERAISANA